MASKTPTYGKDLPGNLGNTDILRAIYDKVGEIQPSPTPTDKIEQKLDTLIIQTDEVNNNIIQNTEAINNNAKSISDAIDRQTQAIKDISINVNVENKVTVDTKGINNKLDNITKAIDNINSTLKSSKSDSGNIRPASIMSNSEPRKTVSRLTYNYGEMNHPYYTHYKGPKTPLRTFVKWVWCQDVRKSLKLFSDDTLEDINGKKYVIDNEQNRKKYGGLYPAVGVTFIHYWQELDQCQSLWLW